MDSRGEGDFIKFPKIAAKLYDYMTQGTNTQRQTEEIAEFLVSKISTGRLLDIGTGPGRLLLEINKLKSDIALFGLDISNSMIEHAKKNLRNKNVNLKLGNIEKTEYKDNFFDIITTTGSFYLWDHPQYCLEEIGRILKKNSSAYLFETYKDYDKHAYKIALKSNLKKENIPRRIFSSYFLNKQLDMTYKKSEIEEIISQTNWKNNYTIDKIKLSGLPIWLKIELKNES